MSCPQCHCKYCEPCDEEELVKQTVYVKEPHVNYPGFSYIEPYGDILENGFCTVVNTYACKRCGWRYLM